VIASYFNEVGMPCEVKADSNKASRIIFDRKGTLNFLSTIGHRVPMCLRHRLVYQKGSHGLTNRPD
jgi:hypothetical protein